MRARESFVPTMEGHVLLQITISLESLATSFHGTAEAVGQMGRLVHKQQVSDGVRLKVTALKPAPVMALVVELNVVGRRTFITC